MTGASRPPSDFRSDTVTRPCPAMRQAMAEAEVGDDVFGDDPTVHQLEAWVAKRLGKEAALFVPSGTMSNQIAIKLHTQPGEEVMCDARSHVFLYEAGGMGLLSGVQARTWESPANGHPPVERLAGLVRPDEQHHPRTALLALENTHNVAGGRVVPLETMRAAAAFARKHGLRVHLDGARLWNASVAAGVPLSDFAACADTISVCLSKGLGCPIGSLLVGSKEALGRAHRLRKALGGGMRQVGIVAAAGLYAMEHGIERLAEDHARARRLAEGLSTVPGFDVDPADVETNLVFVRRPAGDGHAVVERLAAAGILATAFAADVLRFVTHRDLADEDVERALEIAPSIPARG